MPAPNIFAPINDLGQGNALQSWHCLTGENAQPRLLTAMGDIFLMKDLPSPDQPVYLLDTYAGLLERIESNWQAFKQRVSNPDEGVSDWFKYDLLCELVKLHGDLAQGQCFSPVLPPVIGGTYEPDNFERTHWRVHVGLMGQIHFQSRDLPAGTPIRGFKWT